MTHCPVSSSYITSGMKFGTETERRLLDALGSPDRQYKIVHIAGTNGKGSCAEYLSSILTCAGEQVGTFTSPQIYMYEDMFKLGCRPVSSVQLEDTMRAVLDVMKREGIRATQFELETATALKLFADCGCTYVVLECGMGGRDDATNAVSHKELAIITSVSLEHTEYLGNTIEEICAAKGGIVKDCPVLISPWQTLEAKDYFKKVFPCLKSFHRPLSIADKEDGMSFEFGSWVYTIHAHGIVQAFNAALAIKAAEMLGMDAHRQEDHMAIKKGLEKAVIPGRIQVITRDRGNRNIILDGAHNPGACKTLVAYLAELPPDKLRSLRIIYGCLKDKDADACVKILHNGCLAVSQPDMYWRNIMGDVWPSDSNEVKDIGSVKVTDENIKVSVVQPDSPRAMDGDKIYGICRRYFSNVERFGSVSEALDASAEKTTVVCGTFTYLAEALKWAERR